MRSLYLILPFLIIYSPTANSQSREITVAPEYNIPAGDLAWGNKAGLGLRLTFSKMDGDKILKINSLSISYTSLPARADTLYYVVDKGGVGGVGLGKAVFSSFNMFQLRAGIEYSFPLVDRKLALKAGGGVGLVYGSRKISLTDSFGGSDGLSELVAWGTLVPSTSLDYRLNDLLTMSVGVSYTFMIQLGNTNSSALNYNPNTGLIMRYFTPIIAFNLSLP